MPTLRQHLAQAAPPVSMKVAWRRFLQDLRAAERRGGPRGAHRKRAAVERALDREQGQVPPPGVGELKAGLRRLVHEALDEVERDRLVGRLDRLLSGLAGRVVEGEVVVLVQGWPPGLGPAERGAILGQPDRPGLRLPAADAAALVQALDGRCLGGSRLRVQAQLPPGTRLPAVPRHLRDRSQRGSRSWLPHLDDAGRWSASPLAMARAQAADLAGCPVVIDAYCGCGGNAVAFARAGARVLAIERDPARAALARANARDLGVELELFVGAAEQLLPGLLDQHPGAALFLDPPWGGPGARVEQPLSWSELVSLDPALLVPPARLLLKAPRTLDPSSLPQGRRWSWRFELSQPGADGRAALLALTAVGISLTTQPATG